MALCGWLLRSISQIIGTKSYLLQVSKCPALSGGGGDDVTTLERSTKPQAGAALRFQQADKGGLVAGSEADKRAACRMFTPEPAAAQQCSSTMDLRKLGLLLFVISGFLSSSSSSSFLGYKGGCGSRLVSPTFIEQRLTPAC